MIARARSRLFLPAATWPVLTIVLLGVAHAMPGGERPADPPKEQRPVTDTDITRALEARMEVDERLPAGTIKVQSQHGVVRLSGLVENLLAKDRAVQTARSLRGVRAVIDDLEVDPIRVSDERLRTQVRAALEDEPATEFLEITIGVQHGVVTLRGQVQSGQERALAEDAARGVAGVRAVKTELMVRPPAARPDDEIYADIIRRLEADPFVGETLLGLLVEDGRVTLTGTVGSAEEKARATRDAWVVGVREVDNDRLAVHWWARDRMRRSAEPQPSDQAIAKAVRAALRYDPRVRAVGTEVEVREGVVTLRGEVDTLQARQAAEEDARLTVGVRRVQNGLTVQPPGRLSDLELAHRVMQRLLRDPDVHRSRIRVEAREGLVSLSGHVGSRFEKRRAEELASGIPGVRDVINSLVTPAPRPPIPDAEIQQEVEHALWLHPWIAADEVEVRVRDGIVTLRGEVTTWQEKREAAEEALALGARAVQNELVIRPPAGPTEPS